jgi:hypothetical protein
MNVRRFVESSVRGFMVRRIAWFTLAAAFAVFCVVQDRVTAEGARRYVRMQRSALAGRGPAVTVDDVMQPAISRSVRLGLLSSAGVLAAGAAAGLMVRFRWPDA